jgi:hypothetical protein
VSTETLRETGYSPTAAVAVYAVFAGAVPATVGVHGHGGAAVPDALLASLAAVAVAPLAWRLVAPAASGPLLVVALCSAGAAAIHFGVAREHVAEWWLFGVFFVGSALAQLAWAIGALVRRTASILVAGAVGNAAIIALWVVTRTSGLPFGPDAGGAEAVGVADVAASVLESVIVLGTIVLLFGRGVGTTRLRAVPAIAFVGPVVVGLTTAALVSPVG